jgi:hypothetical protein
LPNDTGVLGGRRHLGCRTPTSTTSEEGGRQKDQYSSPDLGVAPELSHKVVLGCFCSADRQLRRCCVGRPSKLPPKFVLGASEAGRTHLVCLLDISETVGKRRQGRQISRWLRRGADPFEMTGGPEAVFFSVWRYGGRPPEEQSGPATGSGEIVGLAHGFDFVCWVSVGPQQLVSSKIILACHDGWEIIFCANDDEADTIESTHECEPK